MDADAETAVAACPEGVSKKKNRCGKSGWAAYNAKRAKTGLRSDYVRKGPAARIETAVAEAVSTGDALAVAEAAVLVAVSTGDAQAVAETAVAVAVSTGDAPAVAVSEGALVAIPQVHAADGTLVAASETSAVAAVAAGSPSSSAETARAPEISAFVETKKYRSIGVGESSTGEPFLWRGIFDMPPL